MNIGLDIHGVINNNPKYFRRVAKEIREDNGSVFIITGKPIDKYLLRELHHCGFRRIYDELVSIQDELENMGYRSLYLDSHGRNHYDELAWDSFKANYCREHDIDLHIDDTLRYLKYFETPCGHYNNGNLTLFPYNDILAMEFSTEYIDNMVKTTSII